MRINFTTLMAVLIWISWPTATLGIVPAGQLPLNLQREMLSILDDSWDHYKKYMITREGKPLCARDDLDIDEDGDRQEFLSFSEGASYALLRAVIAHDREIFDRVWKWTYQNLQRKNIRQVYRWRRDIGAENVWEEVPPDRRDHLFAWRNYLDNVGGTGKGGVIRYEWSGKGLLWRDGLDAASDADQDIAASLIFADARWGSSGKRDFKDYLYQARLILKDIWEKEVILLDPAAVDDFEGSFDAWWFYNSAGVRLMKDQVEGWQKNGQAMRVMYSLPPSAYGGAGKHLHTSLKGVDGISFWLRGGVDPFFSLLEIIIKDDRGGEAFKTVRPSEGWQKYTLSFRDFTNAENLSWGGVEAIIFAPLGGNGYFDLDELSLVSGRLGKPRYHLLAGDKFRLINGVNPSYLRPAYYKELFPRVDPDHPWEKLAASSWDTIIKSADAILHDEYVKEVLGKVNLPPNWAALGVKGSIIDNPWFPAGGYIFGWDAFRTLFFGAWDFTWYQTPAARRFLTDKTGTLRDAGPHAFLKKEYAQRGKILGGYRIDGRETSTDSLNMEHMATNGGAYLPYFFGAGDFEMTGNLWRRLKAIYKSEGYFGGDPFEYYGQNWIWFGLALVTGKISELYDLAVSRVVLLLKDFDLKFGNLRLEPAKVEGEKVLKVSGKRVVPHLEYVGAFGKDLAREASDFKYLRVEIIGPQKSSAKLVFELYDDDNYNGRIELDNEGNPLYDDKWVYRYKVTPGYQRLSVPISRFKNLGRGDGIWNPRATFGSGGLIKFQVTVLSGDVGAEFFVKDIRLTR